jgi:hypothetical protein
VRVVPVQGRTHEELLEKIARMGDRVVAVEWKAQRPVIAGVERRVVHVTVREDK